MLLRRLQSFDHHDLDFAGAASAEGRGLLVFLGCEAGDALLEGRKLDDHKALELSPDLP